MGTDFFFGQTQTSAKRLWELPLIAEPSNSESVVNILLQINVLKLTIQYN